MSAALRLGSTVIVMEHFDPEQWLALVERYRVTHCQMVPVMFSRLLRLPDEVRARYDTSSLECIVHAAAPCPVHVKQAMIDWLGPVITEYYAATEANGFTFCTTADWLAHPGTVGRPVLGELLILDGEGNECPTGSDGTVWFRGATAFEYFQDPVKTAESRSGRRHHQHRRGRRPRRQGRLPVPDRPQELHDHLRRGQHLSAGDGEHPVRSPGRPGRGGHRRPNDDLGEEVKAVVQLADPAAAGPELAQDLIDYCRDRLAHFKCPRTVDFVPELPGRRRGSLQAHTARCLLGRSSFLDRCSTHGKGPGQGLIPGLGLDRAGPALMPRPPALLRRRCGTPRSRTPTRPRRRAPGSSPRSGRRGSAAR